MAEGESGYGGKQGRAAQSTSEQLPAPGRRQAKQLYSLRWWNAIVSLEYWGLATAPPQRSAALVYEDHCPENGPALSIISNTLPSAVIFAVIPN